MHFDDRLGTVLRLRADGPAVQRIQFRQLLDLLGTLPSSARGEQVDSAYVRLSELAATIPAADRASLLRDSALRLRSPRLVAALAEADSAVAAAALDRAQLSEEQWLDLIPALPIAVRGYLRQRRDLGGVAETLLSRLGIRDRGLPPADVEVLAPYAAAPLGAEPPITEPAIVEASGPQAPVLLPDATPDEPGDLGDLGEPGAPAEADAPPLASATGEGIGALVRKIEAYRQARQHGDPPQMGDSPRLPLGEDHVIHVSSEVRGFDFATDAAGRLVWSDPGVAPMTTGLALAALGSEKLGDALRRRQPLRAAAVDLQGAPAISGAWQIDAAPWFDPLTGRHLGWRGRMRRPAAPAVPNGPTPLPPVRDSQADRIRQMLHELRTPVNAIQGFAEVIQQQLFGPTPHEYRALSAAIAGDAARMLAAFEELERLAKLDSGAMDLEAGETDLAAIAEATVAQLAAHTRQRGSGFALRGDESTLTVPLARIEVERIAWRLLATLAGVSAPGEVLKLRLRARHGFARMDVALPAVLAARSEEELFAASAGAVPQVIAAGVFGVGFALRLVAAEAKAAGGALARKGDRLRLTLPGLTCAPSDHSHGDTGTG